jgi:drug/metabolite transporter (DMT)-like permease
MSVFLLAALAAVGFGAMGIVIRLGQRRVVDAPAAGAVIVTIAAFVAAAVALADGFGGADARTYAFLALAGALAPGLTQATFVHAVRLAGPSRATLVSNTFPLFGAAFAVAFLGEELGLGVAAGILLVVLGAAALAWEGSRPADFRVLGLAVALACAVAFASRDITIRHSLNGSGIQQTDAAAVSLAAAAATSWTFLVLNARGRAAAARFAAALPAYAVAGVVLAIAYEGLVGALSRGRVVVVAPVVATQSLWTVLLSLAVFGRAREAIGPRLALAALLMVAGTALVGAFR